MEETPEARSDITIIEMVVEEYLLNAQPDKINWANVLRELDEVITEPHTFKTRLIGNTLKRVIDRFSKIISTRELIEIYLWAAHHFESFGEWSRALEAFHAVIELCDSDSPDISDKKIEALRWIGFIFSSQNKWKEALRYFQESLSLCIATHEQEGKAQAYNSISILYFEQGEYGLASENWHKALEIISNFETGTRLAAKIHNNLGILENVQGNFQNALAYYSESIPRFEKIGNTLGLAEVYHNMAMTYCDLDRWSEAEMYYNKSHRLAREVGDIRLQSIIKLNRVKIYLNINDLLLAEALCNQALKTFLSLNDRLGEAECYKFLGVISTYRTNWKTASGFFQKGIKLTQKFKCPLNEAEVRYEYGQMLKQKNSRKYAQKQFEQALILFIRLGATAEIKKVKHGIANLSL